MKRNLQLHAPQFQGISQTGSPIVQKCLANEATANRGLASIFTLEMLRRWYHRGFGNINFRMTQLLAGHGAFASYVTRIGKSACPNEPDNLQHNFEICPLYAEPRHKLTEMIGNDLTTKNVIEQMLITRTHWNAVRVFAREVMCIKKLYGRLMECKHPSQNALPPSSSRKKKRRRR